MTRNPSTLSDAWPELPLEAWKDTYATLQLWTQIVGKVRLVQTPWLNHSWHVVLYVTSRGLTTSPIPHGEQSFQIDFDFIDHVLLISTSNGDRKEIGLYPRTVADFYADVMKSLAELGLDISIDELPNEIVDAIRDAGAASVRDRALHAERSRTLIDETAQLGAKLDGRDLRPRVAHRPDENRVKCPDEMEGGTRHQSMAAFETKTICQSS